MAAIADELIIVNKPEVKKKGQSRKALTSLKTTSQNEANVVAAPRKGSVGKENPNSEPMSQKKTKKGPTKAAAKHPSSFEKELKEMQEQLEKLKLEKEQAEANLKEKEQLLKQKEEEFQLRDLEQNKLRNEIKKMQKMKTTKRNPEDDCDCDDAQKFRRLSDIYRQLDAGNK